MVDTTDPRCPECGGAIGATATYCMHCSADLTEEQQTADTDGDEAWEGSDGSQAETDAATGADALDAVTGSGSSDQLLDPDSLADNVLTVIVGIVGGSIAGLVGTVVLGVVTNSGLGVLFGIGVWLVVTAYLVRQRTVQGAVSKSGYAIALVLLSIPLIAISPFVSIDGGASERGGLFVVLLIFSVFPASIAAGIGWVASKFVPEESSDGTASDGGDASAQ
jgi:hypothetical protein